MTGKVANMANYGQGFTGGLTVRGLPLAVSHPGKVFYVSDTGLAAYPNRKTPSDGNKGSFMEPFATIDYAIGQCVASRGDIIYVLPGHTETVTTDGGIALDVAGVAVVGLGTGTDRPVILLDAAAAAVTVSAANCSLVNLEFRASFADVTNAIDVTAAWLSVDNCEFTEEGANLNFVDYIHASSTTDNTADGLSVTNCVGTAIDAAQNSFVMTAADIDRINLVGNWYSSDHANTLAFFEVTSAKTVTDVYIVGNYMYTGSTADVGGIANGAATDNTGIVAHNRIGHHDTAAEVLCDLDGVRQFDNLGTATDTASGYILPAIDS
jgi:hypothetical protein